MTDQEPWFFVRCITHMTQILLQVSLYLFHTFILYFTGKHGVNDLFNIKLSLKWDQDEISMTILRVYP